MDSLRPSSTCSVASSIRSISPSVSFEDIATSKPFRFLVGPEKREFTIHSALVASLSPALDRLVNGNFKEAKTYLTELEDVDDETFSHFVQYAYTGQYGQRQESCKHPTVEPTTTENPTEKASAEWGWSSKSKRPNSIRPPENELPKIGSSILWQRFKDRVETLSAPTVDETCHLETYLKCSENDLVAHARVYNFAHCWDVTRLQKLSLQRLGHCLRELRPTLSGLQDVIPLLELCYEGACSEELRSLVSLYSACRIKSLCKIGCFNLLLPIHGMLGRNIIEELVNVM